MLPHADNAHVSKAKICSYLLSSVHPVGRFKARVFLFLGYRVEAWTALRDDLLQHGRTGTVLQIENNAYGMKVVISATLKGPNGSCRGFRSVWLIARGSRQPRLVTAFPEVAMFSLHQMVALTTDIPAAGLRSGDLGAVVAIHDSGHVEVEFVAASGRTQALLTLSMVRIRSIGDQDLIAVRSLVRADR